LAADSAAVHFQAPCQKRPLSCAAEFGRRDIVALLLAAGADPNAQEADNYRTFPLVSAAKHNDLAMVQMLLARRARSARSSSSKNPNPNRVSSPTASYTAKVTSRQNPDNLGNAHPFPTMFFAPSTREDFHLVKIAVDADCWLSPSERAIGLDLQAPLSGTRCNPIANIVVLRGRPLDR
jgi:hypothetical protein